MANTFLQAQQNASQLDCQPYQRDTLQSGVVHIGVGAFHRAHQAVYFDRLLALDSGKHWGITGVNIRPQDTAMFDKLVQQQGEYVLKTMNAKGDVQYEHIRSLVQLINGAQDPSAVDAAIASPNTKLITTTVTEGGYYLDESQRLLTEHSAISADLNGERQTLYAFLYAGLKQRAAQDAGPITILCCDNLRHNGKLLRTGLMQFLDAKQDAQLMNWVSQNASFPCSMVDRITPKPNPLHIEEVQTRFGIADQMSVMAEDYLQWVIEDNFAAERPDLDKVGVQFVTLVDPYEEAKIRILNAGHTCVTYQAALKGLTTFDAAMRDAELRQYFENFIVRESIPAIGESIVDLSAYYKIIAERFSNQHIGDTVERICTDGYAKFPIFVLPTLQGCYRLGFEPTHTLEAIASWFVFFQLSRQGRIATPYNEPNAAAMTHFTADEQGIKAFVNDAFLWADLPVSAADFCPRLTAIILRECQRYQV